MAEAANDHVNSSNMRSSGGPTSNNPNAELTTPGSLRASPLPHPPPITTAALLPSVDSSGESVDSFEDSKSSSTSTTSRLRPQVTWSSYQPRNSTTSTTARRERSLSSVVSPYALSLSRGCTHHQRSSSAAVLDLDYSSFEAKAKRRSLSTCGGDSNSVSPPAKAAKSLASDEETTTAYTTSSSSTTSSRPISRTTKLASTSASKASVRFDESKPPSKCHHLLSDDEPPQPPQPQAVQRTHSNPEMELCPVCLARKECEILLKRTYSKVIR